MYTSVRRPIVFDSNSLRWIARASAAVLVVIWLALLSTEARSANFDVHLTAIYQVAALAIIFAGYVIGWQHELAGGSIAVFGTIVFFAVNRLTLGGFPPADAAWFAAPALLYLLAWYSDNMSGASQARQP
jgi:hypothetical protein